MRARLILCLKPNNFEPGFTPGPKLYRVSNTLPPQIRRVQLSASVSHLGGAAVPSSAGFNSEGISIDFRRFRFTGGRDHGIFLSAGISERSALSAREKEVVDE